ncbi:MAG: chemotaxis protein CheX [Myxococcales bacterium]|nr:MAG: chemotaxis protein CheX [Myxococcales bacterium]
MTPALKSACLEALVAATGEVASIVLAGSTCEPLEGDVASGHGAYLSLSTPEEPIQVAIIVGAQDCQLLAKALLGLEGEDEDLPAGDVSDAMCEIINMIAGGLKRRVSGELAVTLGLPMFVSGQPLPNQQQEVSSRSLRVGDASVKLILITQDQNVAPLSRRSSKLRAAAKEQSL